MASTDFTASPTMLDGATTPVTPSSPGTAGSGSGAGQKKTPAALVCVVHGMGQQAGQPLEQYGNFKNNLRDLNANAAARIKELFPDRPDLEVQFRPVEWHSSFHGLPFINDRMGLVSLPNIPSIRLLMSDWLSDVCFYYAQPSSGTISAIVARKLNEVRREFLEEFPDFTGPTIILGHSLGGVISFDLLCHEGSCSRASCPGPQLGKENVDDDDFEGDFWGPAGHSSVHYPFLDFKPAYLFLLGCPLGAVHVQRNQSFKRNKAMLPCPLVNIFQSHDPFGYRLEPLVMADYAKVPPEQLEAPASTELVPANNGSSFRDLLTVTIRMPELPISLPRMTYPVMAGMQLPSITLPSFSLPSMMTGTRKVHVEVDYTLREEGEPSDLETGKRKRSQDDEPESVSDEGPLVASTKRTRTDMEASIDESAGTFTRLGSFLSSSFSSFRAVVQGADVVAAAAAAEVAATEAGFTPNLSTMLADAGIEAQQAVEPTEEAVTRVWSSSSQGSIEPPNPRLDYQFAPQPSYFDGLSANEYLKGIRGHFAYWRSREAMAWMIRTAIKLADEGKAAV